MVTLLEHGAEVVSLGRRSSTGQARAIRLAIVTPVHNDWDSLAALLADLDRQIVGRNVEVKIVAVDDGSVVPVPSAFGRGLARIDAIKVVHLAVNLGHQRAIAVGLCEALNSGSEAIIVMDADGEDKPSDALKMLDLWAAYPMHIIVAGRAKRSEGLVFRSCYIAYKSLYHLATGSQIGHGNFCLIPASRLQSLLHLSYTWNNIAASVTRSRIPYRSLATDRGKRYFGQSGMNFTSLVLHGLSAISVYLDVVTARVLLACSALCVGVVVASLILFAIKLFTDLAIPGWTTTMLGILTVMGLQLLFLTATTLFSHLNARGQNVVIPLNTAPLYVSHVDLIKYDEEGVGTSD